MIRTSQKLQLQFLQPCALLGLALKKESVGHSVMSNYLRPYGLYSPPGSSVQRIFQTRILEWVAIPFSRRTSWCRDQTRVSCTGDRFFTRWASQEVADLDLIWSISVFWKAWSNFLDLRMLTILGKNFRSQDSERQVRMTFSLTVNIGHHVLRKEQETEHTESRKMHLGVPFITKSTT